MQTKARAKLAAAGVRPTRQRVALAALLFGKGCRHVTAETLHAEAAGAGARVSLATVYNTLNAFVEAGLLRQVAVDAGRVCFDTNTSSHHHFFDAATGSLVDIPAASVRVDGLPAAPAGSEIDRVDVIVRLKPKR